MTDRDAARRAADAWFPHTGAVALAPLGEGYINDTWLLESAGDRWVLQRLNERVFPDPEAVMRKVAAVVAHLEGAGRVAVPPLRPTATGASWHRDHDGSVWRLWGYVPDTRTLERLDNPAQARAAGGAFGDFQQALAELPVPVADPIPGFMRLGHYLAELDAAVAGATRPLAAETRAAVAAVAARRELCELFQTPDRLIHGDCKVNNLLYRAGADRVACVIDLDTVMWGHWAWDFGDLVRSAAGVVAGVEAGIDLDRYRAVVEGFLASGAGAGDVDALVLAPRFVTLMLGVRFLTDHLRGDRYFKVAAAGENLDRARGQLALLAAMEERQADMRALARGA